MSTISAKSNNLVFRVFSSKYIPIVKQGLLNSDVKEPFYMWRLLRFYMCIKSR